MRWDDKLESSNNELNNDARLEKLLSIERQIGTVADAVLKAQLSSAEREKLLGQNKSLSARAEAQNSYIDYANSSLEKIQESNYKLSELCKSVTDKKDELEKDGRKIKIELVFKERGNCKNAVGVISDIYGGRSRVERPYDQRAEY